MFILDVGIFRFNKGLVKSILINLYKLFVIFSYIDLLIYIFIIFEKDLKLFIVNDINKVE